MSCFPRKTTAVAALACIIAVSAFAEQTDFDDLARRAAAAVDARPDEAADLYRQALALRPDWAEGWFYMGTSLFKLRRFAEARDALHRAAELAPKKGTVVAFLGMAEYELGEYQQAWNDLRKGESMGLADRPAFVAAVHYRAALVGLRRADFVAALDQLRTLAQAGNDSGAVIQALGLCTLNIASTPDQIAPDRLPLIEAAGRAAWEFEAQHPEKAGPRFEELVTKFPNEPGVHYMYGVFLLDRDPARAEQEFRKELQLAPGSVPARVRLALLLIHDGQGEEAVRVAQEAVRLQPKDALCLETLGRALLLAGRTNDAIAALEKAEKLAPAASPTHYYLQQAYTRAARTADAEKERAEWERLRAQQQPETIAGP